LCAMSGSQRGFGGFGRQSVSPQEHKYLSISRTGVHASGVSGGSSGGGKRSRRSSSVSSAALAAAASAAGVSSVSAMDSVTTPATQRTHYIMRTSGRKSHGRKHVRASDAMMSDRSGMDVSASVETSGSATASASAVTEFTEGDSVMDNAAGIDNERDGDQSSGIAAVQQKERIEELERELEEVKKEREAAQKLAEERLRNCEALQAEVEALRQRYFNALCLAVKLDGRRGTKDASKSDMQQLHLGSQQELYDMAKSKGVPVDEYPAWVAANLDTQ